MSETSPQTGKSITRSYDAAGQLLRITDAATGVSTVYTYDLDGHRVSEHVTTPNAIADRAYSYSYDAVGQMTAWHDAVTGLNLNLRYDAEGNLAETFTDLGYDPTGANTDPNSGAVLNPNYRYLDHVYTYDAARRLQEVDNQSVNAQGQATRTLISAYTYDATGNRQTWNNAGTVVTYTYDDDHRVTGGTWTDPSTGTAHTESWTYDHNGNVLTFTTDASGTNKTTTNTFDEQNHNLSTDTGDQQTTRRYDLSGRMTRMVMVQGGKTYSYDYTYYGDGREQGINAYGDAHGNSSSTYDANLNRIGVNLGQGDGQDRVETKTMVIDNDGHILKLTHDDGKSAIHEVKDYAYAQGNPVGEVGHGTDTETNTVKLDAENYSLVINLGADTPSTAVTSYTTRNGDTLQGIAAAVYGNPSLWFVIADANGLNAGEPIPAGRQLTIPNNIQQGHLTADTHKLYNANDIIGSSLPNLVAPPPPSHGGGCGSIIMIIIVVVIAVVVAWATAGAGLLLVNAALGTAYTSLAVAASTSLLATVAATAVAGALVAAVGSIVQQGLFIALGYMKPGDFSWNAVGHAAVVGAITGAATAVGAAAKAAEIAGNASKATYLKVAAAALRVTSAASKQLLDNGHITSWTSLAGAALGGAKTDIAGANIGGVSTESLSGVVSANTLGYVTPWVQLTETYVRNDGKLTPTDWAGAVGQTLGNAVSSDTASPLQNAVNKIGVNLLVAGALSHYGKDAAQSYAENAIGQEVGQYLGDQITRSFNGVFSPKTGTAAQRPAATANANANANANAKVSASTTPPADNYVMRRDDGQNTDAYGNPIAPLQVADSGATTTDVAPGLLAGSGDANANQTPSIESHPIAQNETYWSIARNQLIKAGGDPSDADIQRQVYALMQMNPGVDPRNFHVGDTITLIGPNSGTTISAGTLAAYGQSNADYQNYREAQAQQAQAQEAMALRAAYAGSGNGYSLGGTNFGITSCSPTTRVVFTTPSSVAPSMMWASGSARRPIPPSTAMPRRPTPPSSSTMRPGL